MLLIQVPTILFAVFRWFFFLFLFSFYISNLNLLLLPEYVGYKDFDAVIADCQMPVMDGYQFAENLRRWESDNNGTYSTYPYKNLVLIVLILPS
jgi:CheY-like chemotaxis protein